ncbi:hypothetical protein [Acetomicrobium sp.]|uniref:hypothetical protein n=1 Tax=Acetomicrobium sp. TaxID=1872099 RepID=UPI002FC73502
MKAAAVRSDHALLRAGAGGGSELKRVGAKRGGGQPPGLEAARDTNPATVFLPFPCPPSASHAPYAPLPAFAALAFAHGADGARPPVSAQGLLAFFDRCYVLLCWEGSLRYPARSWRP